MRDVRLASFGLACVLVLAAGCESGPEAEGDGPEPTEQKESTESSDEEATGQDEQAQKEQQMESEDREGSESEGEGEAAESGELGPDGLRRVARANARFGFDLYEQLRAANEHDNLFYSPLNLATVLAMVRGGARGETGEEIADVLRGGDFGTDLHRGFAAVDSAIQPEELDDGNEAPNRLETANAVWAQQGLDVKSDYQSLLESNYGTGIREANFRQEAESARGTINKWVEERTEGMIPELLPQGSIRQSTRMVLTSAIYFSGAWASEFDPESTETDEFRRLDGETSEVEMMSQRAEQGWAYARGEQWKAVELDYAGGAYRMTVLLPDEDAFREVEEKLDQEFVWSVVDQLDGAAVDLKLPKFEFAARFSARKHLSELGMPRAFESDSDFEGITEDEEIFVDDVLHKARVSVDEEGTEAAAASGATMQATSLEPSEPDWKEVVVDRPFFLFIRHDPTGALLFVGRASSL